MSIRSKFTEHPASVGETYGQHFMAAMGFSAGLFYAAFCCALHAVFPFLCERHGSKAITDLYDRMTVNRQRQAQAAEAAS
ncbi:MAG TPA: DUF6356 family protein [Woeseiaceae bacterium]|nr:DUF6356 family protein [Woeseiaceae bacterium]